MNRRKFMGLGISAGTLFLINGCAVPDKRVNDNKVEVSELENAASEPVLKLTELNSPIVIDSIRLLHKGSDYFVHVRSKEGAEGLSVTNSRAVYLYPVLNQLVIPYFVGKDARNLEADLFGVYRYKSNYKLQGLAFWCPLAWVEFAILDMLGRITNKSIGQLLGVQVRRDVPFYVASGRRDTTPEQEVDYLLKLIEDTGARAVKFRVGGRMSRNEDALPGRTAGLIPLSRKVLGDGIVIHADANSSYDSVKGIEVGKMLEDIDAEHFEEPCPFDHLEETKKVADALTILVAGGEQEFSQYRFRWMIHNRGVDIVQPDLHYYGGLIRSTRLARMAAVVGMPTTVHISGGFGFVYMLHFASYTPDIGAYQEYKKGIEQYGQWFDPPLQSRDGTLTVPQGPGVGIKDIKEVIKGARHIQ